MLHHVSFNAREPQKTARALGQMIFATVLRAPQPPFPKNSWFVCLGDAHGTLIEVMPWGDTRDIEAPAGVGFDADMRRTSGTHMLLGTPLSADDLFAAVAREGWCAELASAGLFQFVKVWVENTYLAEFLTPDFQTAYVESFGEKGLPTLDAKLRDIENALSKKVDRATTAAVTNAARSPSSTPRAQTPIHGTVERSDDCGL